jgi:hypothetical protein
MILIGYKAPPHSVQPKQRSHRLTGAFGILTGPARLLSNSAARTVHAWLHQVLWRTVVMTRFKASALVTVGFLAMGFFGLPGWPVPAQEKPAAARKWEYNILTTIEIEKLSGQQAGALVAGLNKLGEEGWELVAIEPGHVPPPVRLPRYVFKRPR